MNLWRYIQGSRKGKEANRIEKEAMHDPFLADALAGYEQVKGDHSKRVRDIRKNLPRQTLQNLYSYQVLGIVACLVVLISIVAFFHVYRQNFQKRYQIAEFFDPGLSETPEPVIGMKKYGEYLKNELRRPSDECRDVKGKVVFQFAVDPNGRPYNFVVLKSLCASADEEAIRLVKEGPDWTAGDREVEVEVNF
jgi:Gram-negative bacterial tonB protein.